MSISEVMIFVPLTVVLTVELPTERNAGRTQRPVELATTFIVELPTFKNEDNEAELVVILVEFATVLTVELPTTNKLLFTYRFDVTYSTFEVCTLPPLRVPAAIVAPAKVPLTKEFPVVKEPLAKLFAVTISFASVLTTSFTRVNNVLQVSALMFIEARDLDIYSFFAKE